MKTLKLNRETLRVLSPTDARRVQGGVPPISDLAGCTLGAPCTSGCTEDTKNCAPETWLRSCGCD